MLWLSRPPSSPELPTNGISVECEPQALALKLGDDGARTESPGASQRTERRTRRWRAIGMPMEELRLVDNVSRAQATGRDACFEPLLVFCWQLRRYRH